MTFMVLGLIFGGFGALGFFAVDLFFVITAYLTTQKLLQNWQKLQLRRFYLHRLHTLWPPLAVMCTFVLLLAFSAVPKLMQNILPNYLSSLVFMNNFWQISHWQYKKAYLYKETKHTARHAMFFNLPIIH